MKKERIKVKDCKGILRVGDKVRTDADCANTRNDIIIEGVIGEITCGRFFVWHDDNTFSGSQGKIKPETLGFDYSWQCNFNNENAWIEISGSPKLKQMESIIRQTKERFDG